MSRLLLVEDDPIIANIYQRKFTADGYTVIHAPNGQDALNELEIAPPDIVILDIMLPAVNGLDVLRKLRAASATQRTPVIVFSNAYQAATVEEAWAAGATEVLMKANTNPMKLSETVGKLLAQAASRQPAETAQTAPQQPEPMGERTEFLVSLPAFVNGFKEVHQTLLTTTDQQQRQDCLVELGRSANGLAGTAAALGCDLIAGLAGVYQALFQELHDHPASITVSTVRTSSQTLTFLEQIVDHAERLPDLTDFNPKVLVVEDEEISLRAAQHALERAGLGSQSERHAERALALAQRERFDLFLLDIDMIGMSGVELCARIRALPQYATTPIIFVTALQDYAQQVQSPPGGATDLIAKPYCFVELSLKALSYIYRAMMAKSGLL